MSLGGEHQKPSSPAARSATGHAAAALAMLHQCAGMLASVWHLTSARLCSRVVFAACGLGEQRVEFPPDISPLQFDAKVGTCVAVS